EDEEKILVVVPYWPKGWSEGCLPSTLKVYMAAIAAHHNPIEGKSVGKHDLVIRFLRGGEKAKSALAPLRTTCLLDLSLELRALQQGPFVPLQSVELKFLSMKTLLLLALASIKRVGDLHAFSVDKSCLEFGPANSQVTLRPRPGYVPKVPTTPFRDQVVSLQALPSFALSCPSPKMVHRLDTKLQDLRPALCLLRRPAEDGPLDSGRYHLGLPGTACALPAQDVNTLN
ncbi:hypothetical protein M9458_029642, partial [Cirrhinus mrigala]